MRYIFAILSIFLVFSSFADPIDINHATPSQIDSLDAPWFIKEEIKEYLFEYGSFNSIYDLYNLPSMTDLLFERLKDKIAVVKDSTDPSAYYVLRLQEKFASEESPTEGAVDTWEDMLIYKLNVNKADLDDILELYGVSVMDAKAVIENRNLWKRLRNTRDLRNSPGLTFYGYSNMRNYVRFKEPPQVSYAFHGNVRIKNTYMNSDYYLNDVSASGLVSDLTTRIDEFNSVGDTLGLRSKLLDIGWTNEECDSLYEKLVRERDEINSFTNSGELSLRTKLLWGERIKSGLLVKQDNYDRYTWGKGYLMVQNFPYLKRAVVGDYHIALGQGLVMDNASRFFPRRYNHIEGIFGDVTSSYATSFRGGALWLKWWRFDVIGFYSYNTRNSITNPDGTINTLVLSDVPFSDMRNNLKEQTYGGRIKFNLNYIMNLPLGTYIAVSGYETRYDNDINHLPYTIDIPFDKDNLSTLSYSGLFNGDLRRIGGFEYRTLFGNMSVEGEIAAMFDGTSITSKAMVHQLFYQLNDFYVRLLYRDYDPQFDNPYMRGFAEQDRFDDTPIEKDYRLIDPTYMVLLDDPRSKAERGLYIETRAKLTRKITITRMYLDVWENREIHLPNFRFQGEVEYRPLYPWRIRIKQKIQQKHLYKDVYPTKSLTMETTLRTFFTLTNRDYFNFEMRYGQVKLTPNPLYTDNELIRGGYSGVNFEHHFSPVFSLLGGIAAWRTDGMSQWIFEDTGIDFLNSNGYKYYLTFVDKLSDNASVRFKIGYKNTDYYYTGLTTSSYEYTNDEGLPVLDFAREGLGFVSSMQINIRW